MIKRDQKYFVYKHTGPSGKVYIGITNNINRRWSGNGIQYLHKNKEGKYVQRLFARAIIKYGWDQFTHELILSDIPFEEACYAEKYLIRWYKIHNQSYNISDGGEGTPGPKPPLSKERIAKIKDFMRNHHPMKGKHHTPEAMAKIIAANRNRQYTPEQRAAMAERARLHNTGKTHSEESKKKMSDYRKAHPETWIGGWNKKEVHQYDLEGNYIQTFPSAEEAARSIGKKSSTSICSCINGKCSSAHGYIWRFDKLDFIDTSNYKIVKTGRDVRIIDMSEEGKRKRRDGHGRKVNQYSLEGKYIRTFNSVTDAKETLGYKGGGISKCCLHNPRYKSAAGFLWEYDSGLNREDKRADVA